MELTKLHYAQLEILEVINKICLKNDIEFFLDAGSMLGAIRHSGFIPWDDDIDIGMLRDEYDRFLIIALEELPEGYYIQEFHSDYFSPYPYIKIRKNNTKFVEWSFRKLKIHHGIYVDLFPYDIITSDLENLISFQSKYKLYLKILTYRLTPFTTFKRSNSIRGLILMILRALPHYMLLPLSVSQIKIRIKHLETDFYNKLNKKNGNKLININDSVSNIYDYKDFFPLKEVIFENRPFKVPKNSDKILRIKYGDYNIYPKLEDRFGHNPFKIEL